MRVSVAISWVISLLVVLAAAASVLAARPNVLFIAVDDLRVELGCYGNTIVVFWSDHGYHLGEHSLWAKTSNFELDARVPLIITTPHRRGGRHTDALVELLDLYPTLADLCGLPAPRELEGVSLRAVLDDPAARVKPAAWTQHTRPAYPTATNPLRAMGYSMRTERYRYTEWRSDNDGRLMARELYDHASDPHETSNVADRSQYSAAIKELSAQLAAHVEHNIERE